MRGGGACVFNRAIGLAILPLLACGDGGPPDSLDAGPADAAAPLDAGVACPGAHEVANLEFTLRTRNGSFPLQTGQSLRFRGSDHARVGVGIRNVDTATAVVGPIRLEMGSPGFTLAWESSDELRETFSLAPGDERVVAVDFAPPDDTRRSDRLIVHRGPPSCEPAFELNLIDNRRAEFLLESLHFNGASGRDCKELVIRNSGRAEARIDRIEIDGRPGDADDFFIDRPGCEPGPSSCAIGATVGAGEALVVDVCYDNNDDGLSHDFANAILHWRDGLPRDSAPTIATLTGSSGRCRGPELIVVLPEELCAGEPDVIDLSGTANNPTIPSSGELVACELGTDFGDPLVFTPNPVRAEDGWRVAVEANEPGYRIVFVQCTTDCRGRTRNQYNLPVVDCP